MAGKASSRLPARNFSGLGYTIWQLSGWRRSTRRYIDRGERCRCTCRKIQAPCVCFSASVKKRIGESILDDCPGVSQHRKNLLLRKFGSVKRLRRASAEEIAATDGIGAKLAADVHRFLQTH